MSNANSINRENRKTNARALELLGFELNEIVSFLGVSSNTVKTYLRETRDVYYNDLEKFLQKTEINYLLSEGERNLLEFVSEFRSKAKRLSRRSNITFRISKGKGILGWFHKRIIQDCEKYVKINEEISKEIKDLEETANKKLKLFRDPNICPHLSKSVLKFNVQSNFSK